MAATTVPKALAQMLKVAVLSLLMSLGLAIAMPHPAFAALITPSHQPPNTMTVHLGNAAGDLVFDQIV